MLLNKLKKTKQKHYTNSQVMEHKCFVDIWTQKFSMLPLENNKHLTL